MRIECRPAGPVPVGGWVVLHVTSINDGAAPVAWPVRLHPAEATVSFVVDGVRHRGAEQVDSIVETTVLEPGWAISTGVLVSVGDRGVILDQIGEVEIRVAVQPPGAVDEVLSEPVPVEVVGAGDAADEAFAIERSVVAVDAAARAVREGEVDDGGELDALLAELPPDDRAWVATALLPAAPWPDDPVLEAARRIVDDGRREHGDGAGADRERAILDGRPHDTDVPDGRDPS